MFRCSAFPLGQQPELRGRELRAVMLRSYHNAIDALLLAPVLPYLGVAAYAAGSFEAFTPRVSKPRAFAGILDVEAEVFAAPHVDDHLHPLHGLRDGVGVDLGQVLRVGVPHGEAGVHARVYAYADHLRKLLPLNDTWKKRYFMRSNTRSP